MFKRLTFTLLLVLFGTVTLAQSPVGSNLAGSDGGPWGTIGSNWTAINGLSYFIVSIPSLCQERFSQWDWYVKMKLWKLPVF